MAHPAALDTTLLGLSLLHVGSVLIVAREVYSGRTRFVWRDFSVAGVVVWGSLLLLTATASTVALWNLTSLQVNGITHALLWAVALLGIIRTVPALVQQYEGWEVALRRLWHVRSRPMTEWIPGPDAPFVTVQVPIHAEPPEVVIETLNALSRLEYPAYEVVVIDNNTTDERLWRPVEEHCAELGFRFLHVDGIEGAKAGALNWSRPDLNPRTELVALVDADYQVDPRWLRDTAGFFEDPELGFVQCPHAYRDYEHSTYQRMANAAYGWAQATEMVSRTEQGSGITIGTMSLIRLRALDEAGGWADWCLTEDSELAIRVHAAGYQSIFVHQPYGRGLIPETFSELKKQRYRWTYGPGQEIKRHLRLYLPRPLGQPSYLTRAQKWRHANYGLVILTVGLGVLGLPITGALLVSMAVAQQVPPVVPSLLVAIAALLFGRRVLRWTIYRKYVGTDARTTIGGLLALLAVRPTVAGAGLDVLLGRRTSWQRTDKFRQLPSGPRALLKARTEVVLAAGCLFAGLLTPVLLPFGLGTVLLMLTFGWLTVVHSAGPVLALLAERDLQRAHAAPVLIHS